jgi:1-acyl-sn-glycerol-3-phosphate acyltransferase
MQDWEIKPARDLDVDPSARHSSYRRESGLISSVARLTAWSAVRTALALMHRLQFAGREHLPVAPSFIMVANHTSHLDVAALRAALPLSWCDQIFPLAAGDLFFKSLPRSALSSMFLNAFPVWRKGAPGATAEGAKPGTQTASARGFRELRNRLAEEPSVLIVFPEGCRSRTGEMQAFKAGIGMLAAGVAAPVIPCYIRGAFEAMPPMRRFPRPHKITVRIGAPRDYSAVENGRKGWEHIAQELEQDVRKLGEA